MSNKALMKALNQRPIAVYPAYIKLTGDPHSAIALSQILYWYDISGRFYKSDEEFATEIYATTKQMRRIKKVLHSLGFLKIEYQDWPAVTYYSVDMEALGTDLCKIYQSDDGQLPSKNGSSDCPKRDNKIVPKGTIRLSQKGQQDCPKRDKLTSLYTETTTETTTGDVLDFLKSEEVDETTAKAVLTKRDKAKQANDLDSIKIFVKAVKDEASQLGWSLDKALTKFVASSYGSFQAAHYQAKFADVPLTHPKPPSHRPAAIPSENKPVNVANQAAAMQAALQNINL